MTTREEILNFSSNLFLRYGIRKTTMEDVARICRIGKATLYKFFKNKEELFKEVLRNEMENILSTMEERIRDINSVKERLRILFRTEYMLLKSKSNLSEVLTRTGEFLDREIKEIINEFYERQRRIIREILSAGVKNGEIEVEDISLLSLAMMAAGQGLYSYFRDISDERKALKSMDYLIETLFSGIGVRKD